MNRLQTNKKHSGKFLRQRKFFLFLPLIVTPSLAILFYLLGGGRANSAEASTVARKGLITSLPAANTSKDNSWNKMQYYEQADKDSAKRHELIKNDPNYNLRLSETTPIIHSDTSLYISAN